MPRLLPWVVTLSMTTTIGATQTVGASTSYEAGALFLSEATAKNLGVRLGPARPGTSGAEFGLTAFDAHGASGVWFGGIADLAYASAIAVGSQAAFVPRLGVTALGALGEGGGGAGAGLVVGAGVVLPARGFGLRADVSYRTIPLSFAPNEMWSVSIGLVSHGKSEPSGEGR